MSWYYEDGLCVVTAAVPAERGALVVQALQKVVDARKDEQEAYYGSVLAADRRAVAPTAGSEPAAAEVAEPEVAGGETADVEHVAEPTEPDQVAEQETNGSTTVLVAANAQHPDCAVAAQPAMAASGLGDVSAETECLDVVYFH